MIASPLVRYDQQETFVIGNLTWAAIAGSVVLAICCGLCVVAAVRSRPGLLRRFWVSVAIILIALFVYRATGSEHRLDDYLRGVSRSENWYDRRRPFQAIATILLILVGLGIGPFVMRFRVLPNVVPVGLALTTLLLLYLVRLVSLHMIDSFLYAGVGPVRVNWLMEVGLIGLISAYAARSIVRVRPRRRRRVADPYSIRPRR